MKLIILILILSIFFIPIGLCEIIKDDINLNNTKIYDKNDKIVSIYDKNNDKSMDIKLISTISDIDKLIKIVEITNYIEYTPNKKNDFITKTKKVYGKNDVYKIEYFIEKYNYTFDYIIINKTIFNNKTGKNETILINKSIVKDINSFWVKFKPYDKIIFKNERFKIKIIHYKKPELGFFKIQTIPIFKNIECKEFTWWDGNWNLKRPILINNINGDNVINYQLKSVNLSEYQINASSTRIINESSGLIQNHWNQSIDSNGNLEYVWCNFSKILNNIWTNNTYYIYYQSIPSVNTISNGNLTFIAWHGRAIENYLDSLLITPSNIICESFLNVSIFDRDNRYGMSNNIDFSIDDSICNGLQRANSGSVNNLYAPLTWNEGIATYSITVLSISGKTHIKQTLLSGTLRSYIDNVEYGVPISTNIGDEIMGLGIQHLTDEQPNQIYSFVRKGVINEPELWTVGNIEYPEVINMTCNLKIITHLTNKKVQIVDMNASLVNESYTNECINLSYDSYIVYMSNPIKISSFTELLNILDNFLVQFLLFVFLIIIATLFYVFIQIVKKKGFKL